MDGNKATWSARHERLIITALCVIGAVRVFVFNAAFPPFNNIDEQAHFDMVCKYSRFNIPRTDIVLYDRETIETNIIYSAPQYFAPPEDRRPPLWTIPDVEKSPDFVKDVSDLHQQMANHEAGSFPVYYALAGLWYKAGKMLGLSRGQLIFWVRFLNVPVFVLLIMLSCLAAKSLYPEVDDLRIALPLLTTFFPQDIFYSITSDMLSPLLFGIVFFMLVQIYHYRKSYLYHFTAGFFVAATFLTKLSNITVMFLLGAVIVLKIKKLSSERQVKQYLPNLVVLLAVSLIPAGLWLVRNYFVTGDALASAGKIAHSGWTVKPLGERLHHPIFTFSGMGYFLAELTKTFWRGEFIWHFKVLASKWMDVFYVASSAIFVLTCGTVFFTERKANNGNKFEIGLSFFVLIVSVLFLAMLSITFDFGNWFCPSREKPYFTTARLMGGALLPFLIIYIDGIKRLLLFFKSSQYLLPAIAAIVIAITWSEISISLEVFRSPYNWFHLIK